MDYEFKLPDLGEGLTEGEIVKWFVKVGDTVAEHQPLAAVLTDKAEVEVPSPVAGTVTKLFGKPGEKVKVHAPLATFATGKGGAKPAPAPAPAPTVAAAPAPAPKIEKAKPAKTSGNGAPAAPASGGYVFNLPDLGEGLTEGELVKWLVKTGDAVAEHQPLAAVLTDKAEVEVPSPKSGTIAVLHAKPGEKVKVHHPLVTFTGVKGGAAAVEAAAPAAAPEPVAAAPAAAPRPSGRRTDVLATPMVRKMAKDAGIDLATVAGTGPQGRVLIADLQGARGGSAGPAAGGKVNATPAVRALAAALGVDLTRVKGTGPGGRVAEGDVRAVAPAAPKTQGGAKPAAPAGPITFTPPQAASQGVDKVPFVGIRRKIAEKMSQSKHTVADVTHVDEVDMTALMTLREQLKGEAASRGVKLTFLPFIVKAVTKALQEFPVFNSSLDEAAGEVVMKHYYNIGIAVAAPQGLLVPNVKGADGKDIWTVAADIIAMAEKVRSGKIDVPSLKDGTITITNIGPLGGLYANPIVNHPEVAILGLMKLRKMPVVRDGGIYIRDMMNLCLTFDHRVADGADAARFVNTIIRHLENPRTLL
jgi:pyruvate dehydrogenase E2 component (dihydrolipoamide acetyltransferase)